METVYYTLTARGIEAEGALEQAAGGTRRVMLARSRRPAGRSGGDKVVDLTAWKAAREAGEACAEEEVRESEPAASSRRERRQDAVLFGGELLATLAVLAVAAALLLRIFLF